MSKGKGAVGSEPRREQASRVTMQDIARRCNVSAITVSRAMAAPHLVRSIVRVTHERHIVLSSLMGAVLLMAADILARWLLAPQELPVGVLTAALGGTYLLWLMHRRTAQGGAL